MMRKMRAKSLAELVNIAARLGLDGGTNPHTARQKPGR